MSPLPYRLSPYVPHDVFNPIPGATGTQSPMDYLSWQTFIALNWPASEVQNGEPDGNLMIGGQSKGGYYPNGMRSSPTVWETFKDTNDSPRYRVSSAIAVASAAIEYGLVTKLRTPRSRISWTCSFRVWPDIRSTATFSSISRSPR